MLPCCYGGGCPHKRLLYEEQGERCVLSDWKKEVEKAVKYVINRIDMDVLTLT